MIEDSSRLARDVVVGVSAALRSAHRIQSGLDGMLAWPDSSIPRSTGGARAERSIRIAHRALRWLSRIPGNHWRNTCLYRSVAECEIRRACGTAARIVIGVDKVDGDVVAHSWVEQAGAPPHDSRSMEPLHPARRSAVAG